VSVSFEITPSGTHQRRRRTAVEDDLVPL
jgi:hypothetical protein